MSLVADIFEELWNTTLNYKGVRVNLLGIPRFNAKNTRSFYSTLYRMEKQELIAKDGRGWYLTKAGRKKALSGMSFRRFNSPFKQNEPKNLLLLFDIPNDKHSYRDWLRNQLKEFGYTMIQKSVWYGPSPLPPDFLRYLRNDLKLGKNVKMFKVSQGLK